MKARTSVAVVVASAVLVLSACTATSESAPTTAADAVATEALAAIAPSLERPTSIGVDVPLEGDIPEGKEIYWLQCSSPACAVVGGAIKEATDAVGWDLRVIDAGLTPESVKAAWQQAVLGDPDAVIASGFSRAIYEDELQQLAARGVPVLNTTTAEPPEDGFAAAQKWGPDFTDQGERLANYVLSQAGEDTNAVVFSVSVFPNIGMVADSFAETVTSSCAECEVEIVDIPIDALGGDLPTRIVTYLQSHPDVNWAYVGYADMMIGVPAALRAASIPETVRFVSLDTSPATSVYIENGDYLAAVDTSPTWEAAFRHIDFLLRYFNGESTDPSTAHTLPVWIVTEDTLPTSSENFPLVVDYAEQYKELWGVSP